MRKNTQPSTTSTALAMDSVFDGQSTAAPAGQNQVKVQPDGTLKYINALGLEATADHQKVSVIWQRKCITADKFRTLLVDAEAHKFDVTLPDGSVRLNTDLTLTSPIKDMDNNTINDVEFTRHGLVTLTQMSGMPRSTVDYLLSDDKKYKDVRPARLETFADLVNTDLDIRNVEWENPDPDMKKTRRGVKENGVPDARNMVLRLRNDDSTPPKPIIRAVVSERFTTELSNLQVLEMMLNSFSEDDIKRILVSHHHHDGDDLIGNLLLPDDLQTCADDSDYGIGVAFRNSEVKRFLWEMRPFAFRSICFNGCIWGRRDSKYFLSQKHLGSCDVQALQSECNRVMALALSHGQAFLNQMMMTKLVEVEDVAKVFAQIAAENAITRPQVKSIADAYNLSEESQFQGTGFGIIQAITRGAQQFDANIRNNMESAAGDILSPSLEADLATVQKYWERLADRADSKQTDKDVQWVREALAVA